MAYTHRLTTYLADQHIMEPQIPDDQKVILAAPQEWAGFAQKRAAGAIHLVMNCEELRFC